MSVYQKMLKVMEEIQYLQKDGRIETGGGKSYKALTDEKVLQAIRPVMIRNGLVMFPISIVQNRTDEQVTGYDGKVKVNRITAVDAVYRIVDADEPDSYIEVASCGTGVDTQDKGSGKAMTYAKKYALLNTFLVPSGDDTDNIGSEMYTAELTKDRTDDIKAMIAKAKEKGLEKYFTTKGYKANGASLIAWDDLSPESFSLLKTRLGLDETEGEKK